MEYPKECKSKAIKLQNFGRKAIYIKKRTRITQTGEILSDILIIMNGFAREEQAK